MNFSLLKKNSIHTKLFMIILVFVCIPLLILGFFWYGKSTKTIENNAVQNSQHLLAQTNEYLDFYLNDLEQSTAPDRFDVTDSKILGFVPWFHQPL